MVFWSIGMACSIIDDFTQTVPPPPTDTGPTTTLPTYELLPGGTYLLGSGRAPGLDIISNKALVGWYDGTTLYAGEIPTLDPEAIVTTEVGLGSVDAGRPTFGFAEQRIIVAWDDGLGYGKVRTLLDNGTALDELVVDDAVDPGTFRISPLEDGSGAALWRDGTDIVTGSFDRLLTTAGKTIDHGTAPTVFDGAAADVGTFIAAWAGPPLGEDNTSTALRAAVLPPSDPVVGWDFVDQDVERTTGAISVAVRAEDFEPLLAWVGPTGEIQVRAPGLGDAAVVPGSTVVAGPTVAWAGDVPVVAWQDDAALHIHAVGLPEGENEVEIASAVSPSGPDMAPRPLNDGTELTVVWEDAGAVRMTEVIVLVR